jgi:hypothetical protein
MDDDGLQNRLAALEARARVPDARPDLTSAKTGRRHRLLAPVALAPALVLLFVASAAAAGAVGSLFAVRAFQGAENAGQPLAGANLECMSPPAAAAYLAGHSYTNIVWQVETGSVSARAGTSTQVATPPEHGFVVPGAFLGDGQLIMIVDQRTDATGVGPCYGAPMP